ncbi:hypothetical protein [Streptomyces chartreusis]
MTTTDDLPAPRTALEAAQRLVVEGKHVHLVSEGQSLCMTQECQ